MIFSDSFIEFLEDSARESRVSEMILHDVEGSGSLFVTTKEINYVAIRNGELTYLPKGKDQAMNEDGTWRREARQTGKPAKIIKKALTDLSLRRLIEKDFEVFGNAVKAHSMTGKGSFSVVKGEEIRYWYDGEHYAPMTGSLSHSCMRYKDCLNYLDMFIQNPEHVSMVIFVNGDRLLAGRALLWKTNKGLFQDRVYGGDAIQAAFREYARSQGWMHRTYNSYEDEDIVTMPDDKGSRAAYLLVDLPNHEHKHYPYLDTFKYYNISNGRFSNNTASSYDYYLTATDGGPINRYKPSCAACNDPIADEDPYMFNNLSHCRDCYYDLVPHCFVCDRNISEVSYTDVEGQTVCNSCMSDYGTNCQLCAATTNVVSGSTTSGVLYCQECMATRICRCGRCGRVVDRTQSFEAPDGNHYCGYCAARLYNIPNPMRTPTTVDPIYDDDPPFSLAEVRAGGRTVAPVRNILDQLDAAIDALSPTTYAVDIDRWRPLDN